MATVPRVTVDLVGTMRTPISLDELVTAAGETLRRLLGLAAVPVIEVIDGGHRLSAPELRSAVIGGHVPGPLFEQSIARRFDFETPGGDGARLMVYDRCHDQDEHDVVDACFSPQRTCTGVVVATALALAAAELGGGEFVDINIMMLEPPVSEPDQVIELTRLPDTGSDFGDRCERYLRQFANLAGWPPSATLRVPPAPARK